MDEQTAHPSRMQSQLQRIETPELPSSLAEAEPQASGSISRRASPSPSASGDGSVSNITSFGNFEDSLSRPLSLKERELLAHLDRLKFFLATAPSRWSMEGGGDASAAGHNPSALPVGHPNSAHPALNRFLLPNSEYVSCVLWGGLYHITGTDIVRALVFRFEAFGRPVKNMKKFEEGVFSDLRNLKPGVDACLEEPKVRQTTPARRCQILPNLPCALQMLILTCHHSAVPVLGSAIQVSMHSYAKEAESLLLVSAPTIAMDR